MFRQRRNRRYNGLLARGFLRFEAKELSAVTMAEAPYLKHLVNDRVKMIKAFMKQAEANGWSKTRAQREYRDLIKSEYKDHAWVRNDQPSRIGVPEYKASPWELLREYRQQAIERGEYFPNPRNRGKGHHKTGPVTRQDIMQARSSRQAAKDRARERRQHDPDEMARYQQQRRQQRMRAKERAR